MRPITLRLFATIIMNIITVFILMMLLLSFLLFLFLLSRSLKRIGLASFRELKELVNF
jgi:hypothetical protein